MGLNINRLAKMLREAGGKDIPYTEPDLIQVGQYSIDPDEVTRIDDDRPYTSRVYLGDDGIYVALEAIEFKQFIAQYNSR